MSGADFGPAGCLFAGCALALAPEVYAERWPTAPIVLVEPDLFLFALCLASRPLDRLFAHGNLICVIGMPAMEVINLLDRMGLAELPTYRNPAIVAPNQAWFDELDALARRNREKREINANTLRRFGPLWLRNMCRNLGELRRLEGINRFAGTFADVPVVVLAAGPSLDGILPSLAALRQKAVIVAVDTAVRACVRAGVEPDFIVLVDPQYWAWRHLDGMDCPSSVLIAESAVWPAVFRFHCRAIYLCASLFPLGKFLEERTERKAELGAGGSVTTTAWDFARYLGARDIYVAALDLGYPDRKTHFTGSIFEDRTHAVSDRLATAETAGYLALYGAGPYPVPDYRGGTVLTDKRLILYAWWFESKLASVADCRSWTLTSSGVRIPGFSVAPVDQLLALSDRRTDIDERLSLLTRDENRLADEGRCDDFERCAGPRRCDDADNAAPTAASERSDRFEMVGRFERALDELVEALQDMRGLATEGQRLARAAARAREKAATQGGASAEAKRDALEKLNRIDRAILAHPAKEMAAMVFDAKDLAQTSDALAASLELYSRLERATSENLRLISKFR